MIESIYYLNEQGRIEPMAEEPFDKEDTLQELVANHPELLSGERINPDDPRRFILIGREQGIPITEGGGNWWALDALLIDQDAVPTLVEVKRSANPQVRREVVGQMLDYAAHARHTWNVDGIRRDFEESIENPSHALAELLQSDEEPDADEFWQRVETNLRAARLRLLFVADGIPDELARVVEFLNEQMPAIEVLAVEIKQFRGETGQTLVPRVIGRTTAAPTRRTRTPQGENLNEQTLIESFPDEQVQLAAKCLFEIARKYNADSNWSSGGASIRGRCRASRAPVSVAWIYAPGKRGWMGAGGFVFGAGNGQEGYFENLPENLRGLLESWTDQFEEIPDVSGVSSAGFNGWAIAHEAAAANIDVLAERLDNVLRELQELAPPE